MVKNRVVIPKEEGSSPSPLTNNGGCRVRNRTAPGPPLGHPWADQGTPAAIFLAQNVRKP